MMLRHILRTICLGACLLWSRPSSAQQTFVGFQTGDTLLAICNADQEARIYCAGYIIGIEEILFTGNAINGFRACSLPNEGPTSHHLEDVVLTYLQNHSATRRLTATGLVAAALAQAYPCD